MSKERLNSSFLLIPNKKDISEFDSYSFDGYILPLKDFSIGFDVYFDEYEITSFGDKYNIYVIINKFLHKNDLSKIKSIIKNIKNVHGFLIEDLGLINIIKNSDIIINESHIINNYECINMFFDLGIKNAVISNELTLNEIDEISKKTKSKLYYTLISRNMLMYSKRLLLSCYFEHYKKEKKKSTYNLKEISSKKELIIKEEGSGTVIFDKNIFSANKYINKLSNIDYFIVNINNMSESEVNIILNNYRKNNLPNLETDAYFLENLIGYKVGSNE